jgi:hypothetical protein
MEPMSKQPTLHAAAQNGHDVVMRLLLKARANTKAMDVNGWILYLMPPGRGILKLYVLQWCLCFGSSGSIVHGIDLRKQ